jgi:hypothetical protein
LRFPAVQDGEIAQAQIGHMAPLGIRDDGADLNSVD